MDAAERKNDLLKLQVRDFGPIVEADIDLRPLTLFVGPSNTGKSYLAVLIYALQRLRDFRSVRFSRPRLRLARSRFSQKDILEVSNSAHKELVAWVRAAVTSDSAADLMRDPLPASTASLIRSMFNTTSENFSDLAEYEFSRCFGVAGTDQLVRHSCRNASKIVLQQFVAADQEKEEPFQHAFSLARGRSARVAPTIPDAKPLYVDRSHSEVLWAIREFATDSEVLKDGMSDAEKARMHTVIRELAEAVFPYVFGKDWNSSYYLPADRTGVMHAHQVVVSALVGRAADAAFHQESPLPTLSGVLADFLQRLIALERSGPFRRSRGRIRHRVGESLAEYLEKEVLIGAVHTEPLPGLSYPAFFFRPEGWEENLPLMRSSSMVSELAPVVLYLRHVVQPGDTLIIEEPEAHLHPAKQVEFMRALAGMVQVGIRVIMTTHSEWILEELANLVNASTLSDADKRTVGVEGASLHPEDVGAWLFRSRQRPRGSIVQEIPLDSDSKLYPAGFDDVAIELHNRGAEIDSLAEAEAAS